MDENREAIEQDDITEPVAQPTNLQSGRVKRLLISWGWALPMILLLLVIVFREKSVWKLEELSSRADRLKVRIDSLEQFKNEYFLRIEKLEDPQEIERIARERYLMKANDEEVFVIRSQDNEGRRDD